MKAIGILSLLFFGMWVVNGCTSNTSSNSVDDQEMTVTGEITAIVNGKDGYTATIRDENGDEFFATISIINMQKSGGEYKSHQVGDKITVQGPHWKDDDGRSHITVQELK